MKTCTKCAEPFDESLLVKGSGKCPSCRSAYHNEHYAKKKAERKAQGLPAISDSRIAWAKSAKGRAYRRNWSHKNRRALALKPYGLTEEDYSNILNKQSGGCAICGGPPSGGRPPGDGSPRAFHVDHDHTTDEVRGLLCGKCNTGLGNFRDNPDLLRKAAAYILDFHCTMKAIKTATK